MKELAQLFSPFISHALPFKVICVGESFCDETFYFKRSCYEHYSLEYIIDGEGVLNINGKSYTPKRGDIFFLDKDSDHEYYSSKSDPWHKIFISFEGPVAESLARAYLEKGEYLFSCESLKKGFVNIFKIAANTNLDHSERHSLILPELFKLFISIKEKSDIEIPELADKIRRMLDNNLMSPYSISLLAKELSYSENHIINVFVKKFGITPYKYYSNKKIQLAEDCLKNTSLTIAEIAELLSYVDSGYFSVCFKKAVGKTPSQYRREYRE